MPTNEPTRRPPSIFLLDHGSVGFQSMRSEIDGRWIEVVIEDDEVEVTLVTTPAKMLAIGLSVAGMVANDDTEAGERAGRRHRRRAGRPMSGRTELEAAREQAIRIMAELRNCACSVQAAERWGTPGNQLAEVENDLNKALAHVVDVLTSVQFTLDRPAEQWEQTPERGD